MIRFALKWLLRLAILAVVLLVVVLLSYNSILRIVIEHRIRAQTGMDAEIGRFSMSLVEPSITITGFKLFNPPDFGGTLFLDIPEIHVEYDRAALARSDLHITLLRLNLGELNIVKNQAGKTNIFSPGAMPKARKSGSKGKSFTAQTGLKFKGIDVLNVSIGQAQFIDLNNQRNNRTQEIGIENCVMKNVRTPADLDGLALLIALRAGDFFGPMIDPKHAGSIF